MFICVGGHVNVCGWACLFVWVGMVVCVGSLCGWAC